MISGDEEDSDFFDRSAEISEIDDKLNRLQELMKASMDDWNQDFVKTLGWY